ncbi:MAG: hypothetical protein IJS90_10370 [Clostridia bacterium]|nr:hypothetical protein [Clostridia bacterium]
MKKKITAVLLLLTAALFILCGCGRKHVKKTINAYNLTDMCDEEGNVLAYMMLADGWIMSAYDQSCAVTGETMRGVPYKVLSEDVFLWQPSQESIEAMNAQDAVLEARILYSDPYGRCLIYGPNVEKPNDANILISPEYLEEIVDAKSLVVDYNFQIFYKLKEKNVVKFSGTIEGLRAYDESMLTRSGENE